MKHQNKAFKCLFVFMVRKLAKRQSVHLLTSSQRERKEITNTKKTQKIRLSIWTGLFSCDFHFTAPRDSCSVTDVICLFHLGGEQGGSTLYSPCPLRLDLPPQKIHTCVFWDYTSAFGHLAVFKIIASSWRELQPCPLNRVRQG